MQISFMTTEFDFIKSVEHHHTIYSSGRQDKETKTIEPEYKYFATKLQASCSASSGICRTCPTNILLPFVENVSVDNKTNKNLFKFPNNNKHGSTRIIPCFMKIPAVNITSFTKHFHDNLLFIIFLLCSTLNATETETGEPWLAVG